MSAQQLFAAAQDLDADELVHLLVMAQLKLSEKEEDLSKSWAVISGLREENEQLKAKNEELTKHYDKTMSKEHGWGNALMAENYEEKDLENEKLKAEVDEFTKNEKAYENKLFCIQQQVVALQASEAKLMDEASGEGGDDLVYENEKLKAENEKLKAGWKVLNDFFVTEDFDGQAIVSYVSPFMMMEDEVEELKAENEKLKEKHLNLLDQRDNANSFIEHSGGWGDYQDYLEDES